MKHRKSNLILLFSSLFLGLLLSINYGCTHDDDVDSLLPPSTFEYGTDMVSTLIGYNFDQNHSSVRWETAYLGTSALLTGRFNDFEFDITFDEDNPENTSLTGNVVLSSVNTGEPGRDEGCLLGTFGTDVSDAASFASTLFEKDGNGGYTFIGDLTFHGVTSAVTGTLEYVGTTFFDENSGINGAPLNVSGFVVRFEFNAKSVFNIESGSIADRVLVIASGQFKQAL